MPTWKTQSISDVVGEIHNGDYVLPVIQRSLVWEESQMELLFDSVMKGNAFGGIIVLKEKKDNKPLFETRMFSVDGTTVKSTDVAGLLSRDRSYVIDGQQRLQSFYIGLRGSIDGSTLYFDLGSSRGKYTFQFAKEQSELPTTTKDDGIERMMFWYSVPELYERLQDANSDTVIDAVSAALESSQPREKNIGANIRRFKEALFVEICVGICTVVVEREQNELDRRQRVVELFRRLNEGGTRLDAYDLIASQLKGFNYKMESFLECVEKAEYKSIGFGQDEIIRLLFILQDDSKRDFSQVGESDALFAITNREKIEASLEASVKFLHICKLYDYYAEGRRSNVPLYFLIYHIFHQGLNPKDTREIFSNHDTKSADSANLYRWFHYSLLNGVFKSRGAGWVASKTGVAKILEKVKGTKGKSFPTDIIFDLYRKYPLTFFKENDFTERDLDNLDREFVLYLVYDKKRQIRQNDLDHIHPKSRLESRKDALGIDMRDIHTVRNYQRLDLKTNRWNKSDRPFKEWLNDPLCVEDAARQGFIYEHLIPTKNNGRDLLDENNYKIFLTERAILILAKIMHDISRPSSRATEPNTAQPV